YHTLEDAKQAAHNRNGECLSKTFVNIYYGIVLRDTHEAKQIAYSKNEYSYGLELDIYYPEYSLAIEVQGEQHKLYVEFFHRDQNGFNKKLYPILEHLRELGLTE
ncbi:1513_t:CDS:2, partial [Funneliformis geosporum]